MTMAYGIRVPDYFGGFQMGFTESHMVMYMLQDLGIKIELQVQGIWCY